MNRNEKGKKKEISNFMYFKFMCKTAMNLLIFFRTKTFNYWQIKCKIFVLGDS